MVEIVRPGVTSDTRDVQVSLSAASSAASGATAIGNAVTAMGRASQESQIGSISNQIGQRLINESNRYFAETEAATRSAVYSNAVNSAKVTFEKLLQERQANMIDKNGNPTYASYTQDVAKIGNDIKTKTMNNITDRAAAAQFAANFDSYIANQQIKSMRVARNAQLDFSRSSLESNYNAAKQSVANDSIDNVAEYEAQVNEMVQTAVKGGVISEEDGTRLSSEFSNNARVSAMEYTIKNDSARAAEILAGTDAQSLGVSEDQKKALEATLTAKVASDAKQALEIEDTLKRDMKNQQLQLKESIENRIQAGAIREDELLAETKNLAPAVANELKAKHIEATIKQEKVRTKLNEISEALGNGQSVEDFSTKDVDEHYNRLVEGLGDNAPLSAKAEVANAYGRKMGVFARELNTSVISGSIQNAGEALAAYTYIRDREGKALEGNIFTNKARDIMEYSELLVERGGVSPTEALAISREKVLDSNNEIKDARAREFRAMSEFKGANLQATTADDLDAENFFGRNKAVEEQSAITYKSFVEDAYRSTGDLDAAKKIAKTRMDKTHGLSSFNGEETYMYAAPEKMFPNVPVSRMKADLQNSLASVGELPVDASKIQIVGDNLTRGNYVPYRDSMTGKISSKELVSYALEYTTEDGVKLPLLNPETGELMRWYPEVQNIQESIRQEKISSAAEQDAAKRSSMSESESARQKALEGLSSSVNLLD